MKIIIASEKLRAHEEIIAELKKELEEFKSDTIQFLGGDKEK
jgi:hypothetical protein